MMYLNTFNSEPVHKKEAKMSVAIVTYMMYIAISVALTVWVAHTLHKNGRVFLVDVFHGNEPLADSVNHLLVVGFYLINLGYVCLALKLGYTLASAQEGIEALSVKVGMVMLVLDQTRPDIGLPVVKVIVPGLRHFWARFGPGRLYDVPVRLGWLDRPTPEAALNPIPMFL